MQVSNITKVRVQVFMIQTYSCYTLQKEVVYSIQSLPGATELCSILSYPILYKTCYALPRVTPLDEATGGLPFNQMLSQNEPPS